MERKEAAGGNAAATSSSTPATGQVGRGDGDSQSGAARVINVRPRGHPKTDTAGTPSSSSYAVLDASQGREHVADDSNGASVHPHATSKRKMSFVTAMAAEAVKRSSVRRGDKVSSPSGIPFILDPSSKRMQQWDLLMMILLLFTATVTPFEIAFIPTDPDSLMFLINRFVDACFICDMVFNFMLAYEAEDEGMWVISHRLIAKRYLRGWFTIDLLSCIPYTLISMSIKSSVDAEAAEFVEQLVILRVVRLLRLIKLLRILRASRVLRRWESKLALSYATMSLIKFGVLVATMSHWIACALAMTPQIEQAVNYQGFSDSWFESNGLGEGTSTAHRYLHAVYWALMTLSTVGYGDIALPTTGEKVVGIFAMCIGGAVYAYVVGAITGIVSTMDEATAKFQVTIDTLNAYVRENKIPQELKRRLLDYFYYTRELQRAEHYTELLELMSPTLRGEVSVLANGPWVRKITFFNPQGCDEEETAAFITAITMKLELSCFAPEESVFVKGDPATHLYIIRRGVVGAHGRVLGSGAYFGDDVILRSSVRLWAVFCLTYVDVYALARDDLHDILGNGTFPTIFKSVRRAIAKLAFRRNVLTFLRSIDPAQLRAAAGMAAAALAAKGEGKNGDDGEDSIASDADSDLDFNTLGAGTVTSLPIAQKRDAKQSRIPLKQRMLAPDSYEGNPASEHNTSSSSSTSILPANRTISGTVNSMVVADHQPTPGIDKGPLAERESLLVKPESVPSQLRCAICHLVAEEPRVSPSGKMFCLACIDAALELRPVCPVTGDSLATADLVNVKADRPLLWSIFEQVEVRCPFHVHGCSWSGAHANSLEHKKSCTFQSWVSKCTWCGQAVAANMMRRHLREECQQYRCPRCAVEHSRSEEQSSMHLESTVVRLVLSSDYRYCSSTPLDITKMLTFHGKKKKPANVNRDRLFNLLRSCYLAWKKEESSEWDVRMVINAAMASKWFHDRQRQTMCTWLTSMAVASGWVEDKYPGREVFDCPYCLEHGEWIGAECGTCGQRWDLNGEHALILR